MKREHSNQAPAHTCLVLSTLTLLLSAGIGFAQGTSLPPRPETPTPSDSQSSVSDLEEELKAKRALKMAQKDYEENLSRACELSDLAKQLQLSLKDKVGIDREAGKKLDRLEKLTKKIRSQAGGQDEEVKIVDRPADITAAVNQIAESAESLSKAVLDTPRQVVSASVIGDANVLLELIKMLRALAARP